MHGPLPTLFIINYDMNTLLYNLSQVLAPLWEPLLHYTHFPLLLNCIFCLSWICCCHTWRKSTYFTISSFAWSNYNHSFLLNWDISIKGSLRNSKDIYIKSHRSLCMKKAWYLSLHKAHTRFFTRKFWK